MSLNSPTNRPHSSYLEELLNELQTMTNMYDASANNVKNAQSLLIREIQRVWEAETCAPTDFSGIELHSLVLHDSSPVGSEKEGKVEKFDKIFFPPESQQNSNPVGRLIGPRGMTIRQFEKDLGCKLNIRGKGCTKNEPKEERLRGRPGWEHLDEPIHVQITVHGDSENSCDQKLAVIKSRLQDFLETTDATLKRAQLVQLAVIEGTLK